MQHLSLFHTVQEQDATPEQLLKFSLDQLRMLPSLSRSTSIISHLMKIIVIRGNDNLWLAGEVVVAADQDS